MKELQHAHFRWFGRRTHSKVSPDLQAKYAISSSVQPQNSSMPSDSETQGGRELADANLVRSSRTERVAAVEQDPADYGGCSLLKLPNELLLYIHSMAVDQEHIEANRLFAHQHLACTCQRLYVLLKDEWADHQTIARKWLWTYDRNGLRMTSFHPASGEARSSVSLRLFVEVRVDPQGIDDGISSTCLSSFEGPSSLIKPISPCVANLQSIDLQLKLQSAAPNDQFDWDAQLPSLGFQIGRLLAQLNIKARKKPLLLNVQWNTGVAMSWATIARTVAQLEEASSYQCLAGAVRLQGIVKYTRLTMPHCPNLEYTQFSANLVKFHFRVYGSDAFVLMGHIMSSAPSMRRANIELWCDTFDSKSDLRQGDGEESLYSIKSKCRHIEELNVQVVWGSKTVPHLRFFSNVERLLLRFTCTTLKLHTWYMDGMSNPACRIGQELVSATLGLLLRQSSRALLHLSLVFSHPEAHVSALQALALIASLASREISLELATLSPTDLLPAASPQLLIGKSFSAIKLANLTTNTNSSSLLLHLSQNCHPLRISHGAQLFSGLKVWKMSVLDASALLCVARSIAQISSSLRYVEVRVASSPCSQGEVIDTFQIAQLMGASPSSENGPWNWTVSKIFDKHQKNEIVIFRRRK